jgi:hypothetical protein
VPRQNSSRHNLVMDIGLGAIKYQSGLRLGEAAYRNLEEQVTLAEADCVCQRIASRIGRKFFSSLRSGVGSGSQVIAVVQATESWPRDDLACCI